MENIVKTDRPEMAIRCILIERWIINATNIHSEYEIITALPLLQWLHECASVLRYTYVASLFFTLSNKLNDFRKNVTEHKMSVLIISINLPEIFLIIRRIQRDIIINVHRSSRRVSVVLVRF